MITRYPPHTLADYLVTCRNLLQLAQEFWLAAIWFRPESCGKRRATVCLDYVPNVFATATVILQRERRSFEDSLHSDEPHQVTSGAWCVGRHDRCLRRRCSQQCTGRPAMSVRTITWVSLFLHRR